MPAPRLALRMVLPPPPPVSLLLLLPPRKHLHSQADPGFDSPSSAAAVSLLLLPLPRRRCPLFRAGPRSHFLDVGLLRSNVAVALTVSGPGSSP